MTTTLPMPSLAALVCRHCFVLCAAFLLWGAVVSSNADKVTPRSGEGVGAGRGEAGGDDVSSDIDMPLSSTQSILLTAMASGRVKDSLSEDARVKEPTTTDDTSEPVSSGNAESHKSPTWYSTAGWLPSHGVQPDRSVNLSVLPMLAFAFFFFGVCIKCYSWMRDQDRTKARGQLDFEDDDDANYGIITAGDRGYREVDIRSDSTSMYDTVTSFRSIRLPANEHTVTSIKSLPNQPYETYRSIILQRADEGVYDSVHSYKAFLERTMEINEVDIEVELVDDYSPRPRSKSYDHSERTSHHHNNAASSAAAAKSRKRKLRRHSGGRGLEGNVKAQAERERFRRHSDKSTPHPPHPESVRIKPFHRRSSPAILEPLLQGEEFKIPLEQSDHERGEQEEEGRTGASISSLPLGSLDRQSSNSSSASNSSSRKRSCGSSHRQRREKLRQKRAASLDRAVKAKAKATATAERLARGSVHSSSGHLSDDSPQSSSSAKGSSSNELDSDSSSDSDVTDSGLVVDLQRVAKQSCFKNGASRETSRSASPGDFDGDIAKSNGRKVHRFKVTFVDDATLSAASE